MTAKQTPQTPLSDKELEYFKNLLLEKRAEAQDELDNIRRTQTNLRESEDADYSSQAHHMGDVGTDEQDTEMNYLQIERLRDYIKHINDALERIEDKTYGICQATGQPIAKGRLEAVPHTRYSIEAKNQGLVKER